MILQSHSWAYIQEKNPLIKKKNKNKGPVVFPELNTTLEDVSSTNSPSLRDPLWLWPLSPASLPLSSTDVDPNVLSCSAVYNSLQPDGL